MYTSLLHPWSPPHLSTPAEQAYRTAGLLRTKGTIFLQPPALPTLKSAYTLPPRPKTRMSAGAVALCKHFERGGASSEHGRAHPYWSLPKGSNERKTDIAGEVLERMMAEVVWRNVMLLHAGVAVYEVRNRAGFGMRWTLEVEEVGDDAGAGDGNGSSDGNGPRNGGSVDEVNDIGERRGEGPEEGDTHGFDSPVTKPIHESDPASKNWRIVRTTFRGFVEPIEGMDHELDAT